MQTQRSWLATGSCSCSCAGCAVHAHAQQPERPEAAAKDGGRPSPRFVPELNRRPLVRMQAGEAAADAVIQLWYSTALTSAQHFNTQQAVVQALGLHPGGQQEGVVDGERLQPGEHRGHSSLCHEVCRQTGCMCPPVACSSPHLEPTRLCSSNPVALPHNCGRRHQRACVPQRAPEAERQLPRAIQPVVARLT
jgi:hypothetical protein